MDISTIALVLVCICVGVIIGALAQRGQDRRRSSQAGKAPSPTVSTGIIEGEVLRFGRNPSGKAWLELDHQHLADGDSLFPGQRQQLTAALLEMRPWLENKPAEPAAGNQPGGLTPAVPATPAAKPDDRQVAAFSERGFVEQIEQVLQARLQGSPLESRKIHLGTGKNGEVLIMDGLKTYSGIDSVPDPEVRDLIRAAVAEWEKQQP